MQLVLLHIGNGTGNCRCSGDGSGDNEAAAESSAEAVSQLQQASRWISHLNHHGEVVGVDHVWVLNPSVQTGSSARTAPSWKTAIYAMIQAKMLEKGLSNNDKAGGLYTAVGEFSLPIALESAPGLATQHLEPEMYA
jgi:hypothetical protein